MTVFMFRLFFSLIILIFFAACTPMASAPTLAPTPTASPLPTPQLAATATPAPEATPTPTAAVPAELPAPAYTITAAYDFAARSLSAVQTITWANRSGEAIAEMVLMIDASVFPGVFRLTMVKSTAGPAVAGTQWERTWLRLPLERALAPGETIQLEIAYELLMPARIADASRRPMVFGWSERQTNLVDWFPYLPPYQPGSGWLFHPPGHYGEHQVYEASDFIVNLQTLNAPSGMVIAASAPERIDGDWRRYELKGARTFAVSFSQRYQVATRQVNGVTVTSYFFPEHAAAGEAAAQTTAESLELFGRLFGPYPHTTLAVVEADFLDGMEYDGLFFLSNGFYNLYSGKPGDYLVALAAHETAHQWWFGLVANNQALEPWLDEALCTYSEKLYYENLHPEALTWWWDVRVRYFQPRGFVDDSIYNPHGEAQAYRAYRDAVYLNGAVFLDELRTLVGDEAFFAFLKEFAGQYAGSIATGSDFFTLLRAHTDADLTPLLQRYFQEIP